MEKTASQIQQAIKKNETVIIGANCCIEYSGRAESFLPDGERIIIIKEDKALLVHQPSGNNPVNYMKPGTEYRASIEDDQLVLNCANQQLKEYMTISISSMIFFVSQKLTDGQSIILQGNEKDFSDDIYNNPEILEKGFTPLSREEHTKYGFIDIFGFDRNGSMVVVECKRFKAGPDAVTQLRRYVERIKKAKGLQKVRGMLVAPSITKNALAMLAEYGYSYKKYDPPKYRLKHKKNQKKLFDY